jgi:hypothetical protein
MNEDPFDKSFYKWTYEDWVAFDSKPGSLSTVLTPSWLLKGCPRCGCTSWAVTNDHWCYCDGCNKGWPTEFAFTHAPLSSLDKHGYHCCFCRGYGTRVVEGKVEVCDDCSGKQTQPNPISSKHVELVHEWLDSLEKVNVLTLVNSSLYGYIERQVIYDDIPQDVTSLCQQHFGMEFKLAHIIVSDWIYNMVNEW